jgi:ribonuclease BN (tRNA processing enzyme)
MSSPEPKLQVRVLGCSGAIAKGCRTTAFLLDQDLLVDAGTGVGDLELAEMAAVDDVLLTHSHLDHIAALPLMLDAVGRLRQGRPLRVHALQATIDALRQHVFNNLIWPDFAQLPNAESPYLSFHSFAVGQTLQLGSQRPKHIEVLPAAHAVPACGFAIRASQGHAHWVFSGDTGPNPAFWQRLNQLDVAMLVIETAFGDTEQPLADRAQHLSPTTLALEMAQIDPHKQFPVYITHTKPAETGEIMGQIGAVFAQQLRPGQAVRRVGWLEAGMVVSA